MAQTFSWIGSSKFKDTNNQSVVASTNEETVPDYSDTWCGRWDSKYEAIKSLFSWYKKKSRRIIRWYIDFDGYFRYFEVGERLGKEIIFKDDPRVKSLKLKEDATAIINYMVGSYGDSETGGTVTRSNPESIAIFGKCVDDKIQEASFTQQEMIDYLDWQLSMKSTPIWTATLVMAGLYDAPPGKQIMFPDREKYGDKVFTIVDWKLSGDETGNLTTMNLSTIDTSLPNEFEVLQSVAKTEADKVRSKVGVVTAVSGDRAIVELEGNKGTINTRYVSKL